MRLEYLLGYLERVGGGSPEPPAASSVVALVRRPGTPLEGGDAWSVLPIVGIEPDGSDESLDLIASEGDTALTVSALLAIATGLHRECARYTLFVSRDVDTGDSEWGLVSDTPVVAVHWDDETAMLGFALHYDGWREELGG